MNLPNKITLTRILMIPIFVLVFFLNNVIPFAYGIAGIIFALAACTDFIDGKIARSRGLVTNLGKFLDPIADKVLVSTAMILMMAMTQGFWSMFGGASEAIYVATVVCICIIMARELIISAFRQIAAVHSLVLAAEKLGKYKAACQDVAIFIIFMAGGLMENIAVAQILAWIGIGLFFLATILTIWSGISYVVKNKQVLKDN